MFRAIWKRIPKTPLYGLSVVGLAILILWGVVSIRVAARHEEAAAWRALADQCAQGETRADTLREIAHYVERGYTPLQYFQADAAERRFEELRAASSELDVR